MGGEPVFCTCRKPDDGSVMIQCNYCDEWYHIACVGVEPQALDSLREYKCPRCAESKEAPSPNASTAGGTGVADESRGRKRARTTAASDHHKPAPSSKENNSSTAKASTTPSRQSPSYSAGLDPVRKMVIEGFCNVLQPYWESLSAAAAAAAASSSTPAESSEQNSAHPDCMQLAVAIEDALFDKLSQDKPEPVHGQSHLTRCGQKYKSKYRTIQFNLKDPKNDNLRRNLLKGHISPVRLVEMTPAEMANEEVAALIKTVREQSITQLTIPDGSVETGFVKKTHKGEDYLPGAPLEESEVAKIVEYNQHPSTMATAPSTIAQSLGDETTAICWGGKIYLHEVGRVSAQATLLSSTSAARHTTRSLSRILPHNLHISGRIAIPTAADYVRTIWAGSSSRDVVLLHLGEAGGGGGTGSGEQQALTTVDSVVEYLRTHQRWAVVAHDPARGIRDFYVATVDEEDLQGSVYPPSEIERLRSLELPALLGILVVAKDGRGVATSQQDSYDPNRPSREIPPGTDHQYH